MWTLRTAFQIGRALAFLGALALTPALAQENSPESIPENQPGEPAVKPAPQPYGGGTPIDVIVHSKFWVDPPKMAPFVRKARPAPDSLNYTPTAGTEPKRPALRTATDLQKMEDELENAGARNEAAGGLKTRHFQALSVKKPKKAKRKL
ncbi:MAG: hypothetical protein AB1508_07565 [Pseudomonadota bacterium]